MKSLFLFIALFNQVSLEKEKLITLEEAVEHPRTLWYSHLTLPPVYEVNGDVFHVGFNIATPELDKTGTANNEKPWLHTGGFDDVHGSKVSFKRILFIPPGKTIKLKRFRGQALNGVAYNRINGVYPEGTLTAEFIINGADLSMIRSRQKVKGEWIVNEEILGKLPKKYASVQSCTDCHEDIGTPSSDIDPKRDWYGTIRGLEKNGPIHWHPYIWPADRNGFATAKIRNEVKHLVEWDE